MMAEEEKKVVNANEDLGSIYKAKYEEVVQNSVPREEYNKIKTALEEEVNNRVENRQIVKEEPETKNWTKIKNESLDKIANNKCRNNLELSIAMCDARDAVKAVDGADIFIQELELQGKHYDKSLRRTVDASVVKHIPTQEEIDRAERVYEGLRELQDESEGDPEKFNYLFSKNVLKANI